MCTACVWSSKWTQIQANCLKNQILSFLSLVVELLDIPDVTSFFYLIIHILFLQYIKKKRGTVPFMNAEQFYYVLPKCKQAVCGFNMIWERFCHKEIWE